MHQILFHPHFKLIVDTYAKDTLMFLVQEGINFNLLCDIKRTNFSPLLPENISSTFNDITLFVLAGYTFESIELRNEHITFEAGFGNENIGSLVSIPYSGIVQILLHDNDLLREIPLFTNVSHPCFYNLSPEELEQITFVQQEGLEQSNLAFASSLQNSRFFKK